MKEVKEYNTLDLLLAIERITQLYTLTKTLNCTRYGYSQTKQSANFLIIQMFRFWILFPKFSIFFLFQRNDFNGRPTRTKLDCGVRCAFCRCFALFGFLFVLFVPSSLPRRCVFALLAGGGGVFGRFLTVLCAQLGCNACVWLFVWFSFLLV